MWQMAVFEWRQLRADATLRVLVLALMVVGAYALANGARWVRFQQQTLRTVADEEAARLASHRATVTRLAAGDSTGVAPWTNPAIPSNAGGTLATRYATLPPASLASFAIGQSDLYSYYTRVSTRSKQTFIVNDEIENPVNLMAGRFDLAFVSIYLLPLLILAITYNVVSAERETGTLDLVLSQPVDVRRVLISKVLTRAAAVLGVCLLLLIAGLAVTGTALDESATWIRLGLWAAALVFYAMFWFATALAVNGAGMHSSANAVVLLGVWLAIVVVIPAATNAAVSTLHPSPSRVELTTSLRRATNEANEQGSALLQRYYLDHPEMMGGGTADMNNFAARSVAVQEAVEKSMAPTLDAFEQRLLAQQQLADRYRFFSPALVMQGALFDLSGTSVYRYRHYQAQVDAFHQAWRAWFFPRIFAGASMQVPDFDLLPRFAFAEESVHGVAARTAPALLGLLVPTAALGWLGLRGLRPARLRGAG